MTYPLLIIVVAVGFSACLQIFTDPRISGAFVWKSLLAFAIYLLHGAAGMVVVFWLLPWNPNAAGGAAAAIVCWVALGGLGLLRLAPRTREPPPWLAHFGIADIVLLVAITAGLVSVAGLI